jgi:hypothetical protein
MTTRSARTVRFPIEAPPSIDSRQEYIDKR